MAGAVRPDSDILARHIGETLTRARQGATLVRRTNTQLVIATVVSSAVTTLVAGVTAAGGPVVGSGPEGWRISCIVAAAFGFVSTLCGGLGQGLKLGDRVTEAEQCVGRLRALDAALVTGSRNWEEIAKEYEEIVRTYPDITA